MLLQKARLTASRTSGEGQPPNEIVATPAKLAEKRLSTVENFGF
jgi:hypothetical protein